MPVWTFPNTVFFLRRNMKHNHNIYSIDSIAYNSKLNGWNPEFKIIFSLLSLFACVLSADIFVPVFVIISMAAISIILGKTDQRSYFKLMTVPLAFIICGAIATAVDISAEPTGDYILDLNAFFIHTTNGAVFKAVQTALKALGAVSSLYMLTLSTPVHEITSAMRRIHIPKLIIELMELIYRFIFILAQVYHTLNTSAGSRLGYNGLKTSFRTFGTIAANLFIISLKKAGMYYDALESRCYTGELLFLREKKPLRSRHVAFAVIYFISVITIMYLQAVN